VSSVHVDSSVRPGHSRGDSKSGRHSLQTHLYVLEPETIGCHCRIVTFYIVNYVIRYLISSADRQAVYPIKISRTYFYIYTVSGKKRGHVIFHYSSGISWSIFIIFVPLETKINTLQQCEIYLLKCLMRS